MRKLSALLILIVIGYALIIVVSEMPTFGNPDNPVFNQVVERYLERAPEETGHTNVVSAVLVEYRAFDTFGEIVVLYTAITSVLAVMEGKPEE